MRKSSTTRKSVSASVVQKNFGAYHDRALAAPVRITKYGRETVYLISAAMYRALKQGQRQSLAASDLSDAEAKLIKRAGIPRGHRYRSDSL